MANRLGRLELSMWRSTGGYPKLRCKTNEARHFVPVVLALLQELDTTSTQPVERPCSVLWLVFTTFWTQFLTQEEQLQGKTLGMTFLRHYVRLSHWARSSGELKYNVTPKFPTN